jgi:hypothetical protein
MRTIRFIAVVIVAAGSLIVGGAARAGDHCQPSPGPSVLTNDGRCFPTPAECATGNYNGIYNGGFTDGRVRGGICVGAAGVIIFYIAGRLEPQDINTTDFTIGCGTTIVAGQSTGNTSPDGDPNSCE